MQPQPSLLTDPDSPVGHFIQKYKTPAGYHTPTLLTQYSTDRRRVTRVAVELFDNVAKHPETSNVELSHYALVEGGSQGATFAFQFSVVTDDPDFPNIKASGFTTMTGWTYFELELPDGGFDVVKILRSWETASPEPIFIGWEGHSQLLNKDIPIAIDPDNNYLWTAVPAHGEFPEFRHEFGPAVVAAVILWGGLQRDPNR